MRVRRKIAYLLFFCLAAVIALVFLYRNIEDRRLKHVFDLEAKEEAAIFEKALALTGSSLETFVFDYTYWDEMVSFVTSVDKEWAQANIVPPLSTFNASAVWIYSPNRRPIYSASVSEDHFLDDLGLTPDAIEQLFEKSNFCHFFVNTPKGVMDVRGATIHPTVDRDRKIAPAGYFFAGRLWNEKFLSTLSGIVLGKVSLVPVARWTLPHDLSDAKNGFIEYSKVLKGWDGNQVAHLYLQRELEGIRILYGASRQMVLLVIVYLVIFFAIIWVMLSYWINIPLRTLSMSFIEKKPVEDRRLLDERDEFGYMANLTNRFLEQRQRLVTEIAEHRIALRALRLSEEKFSMAFKANPSIVIIFSRDEQRFLEVNEAFVKQTGYRREDVLGKTLSDVSLLSVEAREAAYGALEDRDSVHDMETAFSTKSGAVRSCVFSAEKIDVGKKRIFLVVANDITEQKKAQIDLEDTQKQLMHSEKMAALGRFASAVAHEVKNPLAVVMGGLEFLRLKLPEADQAVRDALVKMREAVMRADIIVKDLLAFSRPSKMVYETVDVASVVHDAIGFVELFRHKSDTAEVSLRQDVVDNQIYVAADKNQLQQALFNILINAIDSISARGDVTIKVYTDEAVLPLVSEKKIPVCVIEVKDTGCGISKEDLTKLFEPFFTTKRDRKGTGLGLSIVRAIVEKHKGDITIESEIGKGTVAKIALPLAVNKPQTKDAK